MSNAIISKMALSTGYDPEYERRNFMGVVASPRYGESDWIDPLDPRLQKLLTGKIPYEEVYFSSQPITNLSTQYYLTTTLWWLILMFNGYLSAQDIPDGQRIKIPSLAYIRDRLNNTAAVNNRGKITRF